MKIVRLVTRSFLVSLMILMGSWAVPCLAANYGLVIGIDRYQHVPSLEGAVNDAEDIAAALRSAGFNRVDLLTNEAASRSSILSAWQEIVSRARSGDTVVFTYAGHGAQEPERVAGSESDGMDEVFLLSGFAEQRPGNGERILDNEIYDLFTQAKNINIVFVADSCHSGTMTRSFDLRSGAGKSRLASYGQIVDDELPPPTVEAAARSEDSLDNVTFFGAVEDNQVVVEVAIDGKPRGAMSWAFARAMRGAADHDGNHHLDTKELETYLRETVRIQTEGRQLPRMAPRGRPLHDVVVIAPTETGMPAEGPIRLFGSIAAAAPPTGAIMVSSASQADLVWDAANGDVISASGDVVAQLGKRNEKSLGAIVTKWRVLRVASRLVEHQPLSAFLMPNSSLHHEGDILETVFADPNYGNAILFDLANDGTLQLIAPGPDPGDLRYNGSILPSETFRMPVAVTPPFGMDHVIAIVSREPLGKLIALLRENDSKPVDARVLDGLSELQNMSSVQVSIVSIVTGPGS